MNSVKKMACQLLDRAGAKELVQSIENVLFDCDGVLWNGADAVPGSVETVKKLKQWGKRVFYVTNNSTKSRKEYLQKFLKLGYDVQEEEIACTAYIAAIYLKSINFKGKIYLIGGKGIASELDLQGFNYTGVGADHVVGSLPDWVNDTVLDPDINCVLLGFDEHISYPKILKAASYAKRENCLFVATNVDSHLPVSNCDIVIPDPTSGDLASLINELTFDPDVDCVVVAFDEHISYRKILKAAKYLQNKNCLFIGTEEDDYMLSSNAFGFHVPGTGVIINAVKTAARREPIILGKPNPNMFEMLSKVHGLDPAKTLMVGDRLNTDIGLAKNCGLKSMLVLSGVSVPEDLLEVQQSSKLEDQQSLPDYYTEYLGKLGEYATS